MGFVHWNSHLLLILEWVGPVLNVWPHQNLCCTGVCGSWFNFLVCFAGCFALLLEISCGDVSEQALNIWTVAASSFSCPQEMLGAQLWLCCSWLEGHICFALFRWDNYGMKTAKMNLHIYTVSKGGCPGSSVIFLSFSISSLLCVGPF